MKARVFGIASLISALVPALVMADPVNLVQNGNFQDMVSGGVINRQLTNTTSSNSTALQHWTIGTGGNNFNGVGLNFLVGPGWTSGGAVGQYGGFNVWSPNTGANNGFTDSPIGGNYIVADGAPDYHAAISQVINGLTVGDQYAINFWWATGQQSNRDGVTDHKGWDVTFGGVTQMTNRITDASHGFSGWFNTTMVFTANSATQTLSFLAQGLPNCVPPLVFLDGVSVTAVPEPSSIAIVGLSVAGMGLAAFRQRRRAAR